MLDTMKNLYQLIRKNVYKQIAVEINLLARFSDKVVYHSPQEDLDDILFGILDSPSKTRIGSIAPDSPIMTRLVVLNGLLNSHSDIQNLLTNLVKGLSRQDRIVAILYNPYLKWLYKILDRLKLRSGEPTSTFITKTDLHNISKIANCEVVRAAPVAAFPFFLFGLGPIIDKIWKLIPVIRNLSLAYVAVIRPKLIAVQKPSLSIIIPARNEKGNIENAVTRLPQRPDVKVEIIFVEGNSTDGTWEEIQRVITGYQGPFLLKAYKQSGKGKADAARLGLEKASHDILTILDADLTMPPELLYRFYDAYCEGHADFVNGSRLIYPMEGNAMRFLNRLGNVFFAKACSYVLGVRIGDSLCGTKLFTKADYQRMIKWRQSFGDFDPFGDFELLFPAAIFGLGIIDVPIAYRDRTYGTTNIRRFRDGLTLLKMVAVGFFRVKMR